MVGLQLYLKEGESRMINMDDAEANDIEMMIVRAVRSVLSMKGIHDVIIYLGKRELHALHRMCKFEDSVVIDVRVDTFMGYSFIRVVSKTHLAVYPN